VDRTFNFESEDSMQARHLVPFAVCVLVAATAAKTAPKIESSPKYQALLHAVIQTDVSGAKKLLDEGLDPNARVHPAPGDNLVPDADKPEDQPLLTVAACFGVPESPFVAMLLELNAEVDIRDSKGRTPLMYAVELGWGSSIDRLIEHKADVNAADSEGVTVLMHAMGNRHREIVANLLDKGAKINASDSRGRTPLMHAVSGARDDPWRHIGIRIPGTKEPPDESGPRYVELIRFLLDHGADPNAKDKDGDTALTYARSQGSKELIRMLKAKRPGNR
jgi:ankyrin repeat protein